MNGPSLIVVSAGGSRSRLNCQKSRISPDDRPIRAQRRSLPGACPAVALHRNRVVCRVAENSFRFAPSLVGSHGIVLGQHSRDKRSYEFIHERNWSTFAAVSYVGLRFKAAAMCPLQRMPATCRLYHGRLACQGYSPTRTIHRALG